MGLQNIKFVCFSACFVISLSENVCLISKTNLKNLQETMISLGKR